MGYEGNGEVYLNEYLKYVMDQRQQATQRRVMERRTVTMGFHHGHLQVLPPTWAFLILTCKKLIDTWYVGNKRDKITTLELLRAMRVAHLRTHVNMNAGR